MRTLQYSVSISIYAATVFFVGSISREFLLRWEVTRRCRAPQCNPGDVFGELALLYNLPRAASVEACELTVRRPGFRSVQV